jgi:hypothetical protein
MASGTTQRNSISQRDEKDLDSESVLQYVGVLCNGSISDFDSESVGSIPTTPAKNTPL